MPTSNVASQFTATHGKLLLVMSLDPGEIGRRITQARVANGWTQLELAINANVSPSTVYRWEKGKLPSVRELVRLAGILGVEGDYLVEGEPNSDTTTRQDAGMELRLDRIEEMLRQLLDEHDDETAEGRA